MIESILISIVANIITEVGKKTLKSIINNNSLETEIEKAFSNALDKWSNNEDIKENEKIFTRQRFSTLIECIKSPEKIKELDKGTTDIIEFFKIELQKSQTAWNYIQDIQFQEALNRFNSMEQHISGLKTDLLSQLEHLENLFNDTLIPYKETYKHHLDPQNTDLLNQFHNKFIGRETDLDKIDYLIKLSNYKIVAIVSDGGYGKTRLCIEYFQKYVDTNENIEAWVLNMTTYKNLRYSSQINNDKLNIILIDDAHKNPKILNDIINISNGNSNIKILMTVRRALYDNTITELATHNRNITPYPIERLTYIETQSLFKSQLPWKNEIEIKQLAEHSKGIPIVILGLCQTTINGKYKHELSEEDNFRLFVKEQKQQVINDINGRYFVGKEKINKTIELLSFFSPIKNSNEEIHMISNLNEIPRDETNSILNLLEKHEFISKGNEIVIKPDPYSDTILLDSSYRIEYLLQKDISPFLDRLIRNLIEVEQSARLSLDTDKLLSGFISSFKDKSTDTSEDISNLLSNLETLKSFTYKKPRICYLAIRDLIESKYITEDFWQKEDAHIYYKKSFSGIHKNIEIILSIVALNIKNDLELNELYQLLWSYKSKKPDSQIFNKAFGYKVYDFPENGYNRKEPFQRQFFLLNKLESELQLNPNSEFFHTHIFECIKTLLVLDFEDEAFYDKYTHALSFSRHYVYQNTHTELIRINSLKLLFKIYELSRFEKYSEMYFDRILGVLHFMTKEEKRRPAFNQSKEVELVLEFLFELLEKEPNLFERSEIISQIKIFEHKEIKDEYTVKRQELLEKAESVSTVKERLSLLFLDEYFSLKANISSKLKEIINQYANNTDFYKDIIEINTELNQNNSSNFREILSDLTNNNPVMAKELLKFAISNSPEQVCSVSSLLKANYKDTEYFYSTLEEIWNLEFECTKGSVLWLLTYGRNREIELYREDDLKYFEYVVENKLVKQLWSTSFTLSKYILINPIRTLNLIASIFEISENEREDGYILKSIFEEETILQNHKDLIKEFIVSHTQQFPINHHYLKGALHFLENSFGFESLFEYLKVKIELYEKKRETIHLSHHERYINKEKTQEQTERDFIKVIKWHSDLDTKSEYNHKVLVEFLSPKEIETKSFKTNFKVLVDNAGDDIDKIVDLCQTLDVFENKNEQVTSLLIDVANEICKKHNPKKEQLINIFGYNYINNMGVKSGVPGAPFPQDIDKKEEITTILNKYEMHSSVKEVFEYAFKAVEGDIEANIFSDTKW